MPATATLNRPAFSDVDSLTAARFNDVTVLSVIVPDATGSAEGVVRLAGDLTGTASSPQLAASGVSAGSYGSETRVPTFSVDAKGRIIAAGDYLLPTPPVGATSGTPGLVQLAGDLTGSATSPQLATSGVAAGTYGSATLVPRLVIDAKGRITGVTEQAPVTAQADGGTYGSIRLAGDLTGTAASPQLAATGATAGTYGGASTVPSFTVDAKGRITNVVNVAIPEPPGLPTAWVQFDGGDTSAFISATYARASNVVTVTAPSGHGLRVGDRISCDFTSGSATDGLYTIETVPTTNTFTFTLSGANTGGNVTLELYRVRNTRAVQSVTRDRRFSTWSYWINISATLANNTYLVTATGESNSGTHHCVLMLNTTSGVREQDTRGFSIRSVNISDSTGAAVRNASVVIYGG